MLVLRFTRVGKRNKAYFRLVAADKSRAVRGKFLEVLGSIDPHSKKVQLKKERIEYWLSVGAQPSDTAHNLLVTEGILKAKKRAVHIKKEEKAEEKPQTEESTAAPAASEAPAPAEAATPAPAATPEKEKPAAKPATAATEPETKK